MYYTAVLFYRTALEKKVNHPGTIMCTGSINNMKNYVIRINNKSLFHNKVGYLTHAQWEPK